MTLNENDLAMLREMGRGFNGDELDSFIVRRSVPTRGSGRARRTGHAKSRSRRGHCRAGAMTNDGAQQGA
jgi:hypothetical protein